VTTEAPSKGTIEPHFDIETGGEVIGQNPLLQNGVKVVNLEGETVGAFLINMQIPEGNTFNEGAWKYFWTKKEAQKEQLVSILLTGIPMEEAQLALATFLGKFVNLGVKRANWTARPAAFDFPPVKYWYDRTMGGKTINVDGTEMTAPPLGFKAFCDSTMRDVVAMVTGTNKNDVWAQWTEGGPPHTHNGYDDAASQQYAHARGVEHIRSLAEDLREMKRLRTDNAPLQARVAELEAELESLK